MQPSLQMTPPKKLRIQSQEQTQAKDKLLTHKPWFNGIKTFFTVKVLPKHK